jgi:L-methionine (R)-S-oxide reductase
MPVTPPIRLDAAACGAIATKGRLEIDAAGVPSISSRDAAVAMTRWRIPKVSPEGTCSRPDDLMPEPFDLLATMFSEKVEELPLDAPVLKRLTVLQGFVAEMVRVTGADWVGIYRTVEDHPATPSKRCLVKESYYGAPSRPFFPLTEEFASHSNNSTVGLTGNACIISDTRELSDDEPYYICDGKVRSELCAPIINSKGQVIGIIDAESFKPRHFGVDESGDAEAFKRTAAVLLACQKLGEADLFVDMITGK